MAAPVLATPSTTTLTSSLNPSAKGQSVQFTAEVGPGHPGTGTVNFGLPRWTAFAPNNQGLVTCTTSTLSPCSMNIQAFFSGNATLDLSSGRVLQVVKATTTVTVMALVDPVAVNDAAYLVATVTSALPGASTNSSFTFFQQWCAGLQQCSAGWLGWAVCASPAFSASGTFPITATYSGNSDHIPGTGGMALNVSGVPFPGVIEGPSGSPWGDPHVFGFSASTTGPAPTGTTSYFEDHVPIAGCTGPPAFTGQCVLNAMLNIGTHTIRVAYSGDAKYRGQVTSRSSRSHCVPRKSV